MIAPARVMLALATRGQVLLEVEVLVDEHLDRQRVHGGERGALVDGGEPREDAADDQHGHGELPLDEPHCFAHLAEPRLAAGDVVLEPRVDRVCAQQPHHQEARDEHRLEGRVDVDLRDERVDHDGQRGRQQQAEGAARRDEPEGVALRVALLAQGRVEQAADGDDRDAAAACERREERAREDAHDGEAPGHPAEEGLRRAHDAIRSLRLGHRVADEREQRDRDQDGRAREAIVQHVRRDEAQETQGLRVVGQPEQLARAAHDGEQRRAEERQEDDGEGE
jgi:hypothetical protein